MKVMNMQEAKTHLSRLVEDALLGEDVVLAKAGKPLVRLVPVGASSGIRPLGLLAGKVRESTDCWEPDDEIERLFDGDDSSGNISYGKSHEDLA